jgi:hypothetical protein
MPPRRGIVGSYLSGLWTQVIGMPNTMWIQRKIARFVDSFIMGVLPSTYDFCASSTSESRTAWHTRHTIAATGRT